MLGGFGVVLKIPA